MSETIQISHVHPGALVPSPHNPRRDLTAAGLQELADSVRQLGVLEPILVRKKAKGFEILAGHRRQAAAKLAGLDAVPCIIRDVDDKTAIEITVTENLQREQLTPLEEAHGLASLQQAGWDAETMAAELGKSAKWVARRMSLLGLAPEILKAINKGEPLKVKTQFGRKESLTGLDAWPARTLEMLASVPAASQTLLLERIARRGAPDIVLPADVQEAQQRILHVLSAAAFDKSDPTLNPKQGACTACDLRSSCRKSLFDDAPEAEEGKIPRNDTCLNPVCFTSKLDEHAKRALAEARKEHGKVVVVTEDWDVRTRHKNAAHPASTGAYGDWTTAKKGDKGAVYEFDVGTGKGRWIKKQKQIRTGGKARSGPTPLKVRKQELEQRRLAWCIKAIHAEIEKRDSFPREGPWGTLRNQLLALAVFGSVQRGETEPGSAFSIEQAQGKSIKTKTFDPWQLVQHWQDHDLATGLIGSDEGALLASRIFDQLHDVLLQRTRIYGNSFRLLNIDLVMPECQRVCNVFCLDWDQFWSNAVTELPEPPGWAKLTADGTPKAAPKAAGKPTKKPAPKAKKKPGKKPARKAKPTAKAKRS